MERDFLILEQLLHYSRGVMRKLKVKKNLSRGHVLIMDSDRESVRELTQYLAKAHYRVESVLQPAVMLEKIKREHVDAVIIDVEAQAMKGYELIPVLKHAKRHIPIIVTSTDDSIEVASQVREQGVFFYAIKPLDMHELVLVLQHIKRTRNHQ